MVARKKPRAESDTCVRTWSDQPTREEIREGTAYHAHQADPQNVALRIAHAEAFNALGRAQGRSFACWRCRSCGVFATGRRRGMECGHCGETLMGIEQQAAA